MNRKLPFILLIAVLAVGLVPVTASAGCFDDYVNCAKICAQVPNAIAALGCNLDCDLAFVDCVRYQLLND